MFWSVEKPLALRQSLESPNGSGKFHQPMANQVLFVRLLWRSDASLLFLGLEKGARKAVWTEGKTNSKTRAFRAVEVDGNTVNSVHEQSVNTRRWSK
ncbi:hypothetical protein CBS147332_2052 [Penicillium roqueforti]|nr:hypothetical protein CBS147332_2052 [Penicillium roqueforti]KAI3107116.1 hypothetical protein CBS147331_6422 [Penicillium roqueforti]